MSCSWTPYLFSNLVMVMSLRFAFVRLQSLIFMRPCFRLLTTIRVTWCQSANCSTYLLSTQILSFDTAMTGCNYSSSMLFHIIVVAKRNWHMPFGDRDRIGDRL
ncbi:hypothetical protein MPTK1_8g05370 [Marchantia polymorpha subsp. ruderalis]|uniref:Uncharacterized protein n=1 Tax=Marchantia polymorpha TaxID=3197 RepID=A0A2R6WKG5_MARPO|nr:hypothetical protein MARPO_0081s0038 [Marchantia polymorpha]BBN18772.1 hypothetical protein Mp_8g05370 [Marchantia polymorpha subsp. ruderalis]|eukprot:PTQ34311.1 hypothetical protein MARPO_0081s0038 [Marchantia polymorpha]